MPMLSEHDKSFGDSIMGDEGIMGLGDDGGIMGLSGADSIMGSVGDSIMGEEGIMGLGADVPFAEASFRIMSGNTPVAKTAFIWKIERSGLAQGSSESFSQSMDGTGETDENGILRVGLKALSSTDSASFQPFQAMISIVPAADPKSVILDKRMVMMTTPPSSPINISMAAGGGLAPYIPPGGKIPHGQAGMMQQLLPIALAVGGAALVWFYVIPWAKKKLA
jgi:hypothetical protein